jgi:hypothetical protein
MFGLNSEQSHKKTLEAFFKKELNKTSQYHPMDYCDTAQTLFLEMKSRRIDHDDYPTALIGKNKVDFCEKSNADCYFVYVYQDGIFHIKYDKDLFNTFRCADFVRGERQGGIQPQQLFYYIPHRHLSSI